MELSRNASYFPYRPISKVLNTDLAVGPQYLKKQTKKQTLFVASFKKKRQINNETGILTTVPKKIPQSSYLFL